METKQRVEKVYYFLVGRVGLSAAIDYDSIDVFKDEKSADEAVMDQVAYPKCRCEGMCPCAWVDVVAVPHSKMSETQSALVHCKFTPSVPSATTTIPVATSLGGGTPSLPK